MIATRASELGSQIESPDVEFSGRRFPSRWSAPASRPANSIRTIVVKPSQRELPAQVAEHLFERLAWNSGVAKATNNQALVEAYVQSHVQLGRFLDDLDRLMAAVVDANLEFRQATGATHEEAKDAALQSQRAELLREIGSNWMPARNVLNAKLVSQPFAALRQTLEQDLKQAVTQFSNQIFELLARLVDRELLGLVEWLPNNCCAYHFFKRVVIQENDGASRSVEEVRFSEIRERDSSTGRQIVGKRTTKVTRGKGRHIHRFARHQHDVMNAIQTSIRNSQVIMPPSVLRLCQAVPEWLEPFVRVIDGTIFRERIVERDVEVTNWQDVQVRDEPVIGCEPGVIIGPYVLTGWGPREVDAELKRRDSEKQDAATAVASSWATRRYPVLMATTLTLAVLSVGLTFQVFANSTGAMVAVLAVLATIGSAWFAAIDFATASRKRLPLQWSLAVTAALGSQFAVVLWLVMRMHQPVTWVIPVAFAAVAVGGHIASTHFARHP